MASFPGWNSLESVSRWVTFYEIAMIAILGALVGAEVMHFKYSHRKDELIGRREKQQEADSKRDSDAAEAQRKAEVEALQKRLSEADIKVAELENLRISRHLKDDQKDKLRSYLFEKPRSSLTIKASLAADDAKAYAEEIADVLRSPPLNWIVVVDAALFTGSDTKNVWLTIKDPNAIPPLAEVLAEAFRYAEIPMRPSGVFDPGVPTTNEVWLAVGIR